MTNDELKRIWSEYGCRTAADMRNAMATVTADKEAAQKRATTAYRRVRRALRQRSQTRSELLRAIQPNCKAADLDAALTFLRPTTHTTRGATGCPATVYTMQEAAQ